MGVRGLAGSTAIDPSPAIAPVLIQGGGGKAVTALVDGTGAQQHPLHAGGKHGISGVEGELTIPDLMGQTDLPLLRGVTLLRTVQIGHPDRRPMRAQDFLDHALARSTWSGSGCRGRPPPARPTLASRRGPFAGRGGCWPYVFARAAHWNSWRP